MTARNPSLDLLAELATLLARAYLRLLAARAEKARNDAVSPEQSPAFLARNPLDSRAETHTPCVGGRRHEGAS